MEQTMCDIASATDTFAGLTATGWTAVGSIAGGISIIVLSFFNGFALRAANRAAVAANDQARSAAETLAALQSQIQEAEISLKATALDALESVSRNCLSWKDMLASEHTGPVSLFPDNWISAMTYTLVKVPVIAAQMRQLEKQAADVQLQLNAYMQRNIIGRKQITPETRNLEENLERTANDTRVIADQLRGLNEIR